MTIEAAIRSARSARAERKAHTCRAKQPEEFLKLKVKPDKVAMLRAKAFVADESWTREDDESWTREDEESSWNYDTSS